MKVLANSNCDTIMVADRVRTFLNRYEELCDEFGLMVMSEGEEVYVADKNDNLWGIYNSTYEDIKSRRKHNSSYLGVELPKE